MATTARAFAMLLLLLAVPCAKAQTADGTDPAAAKRAFHRGMKQFENQNFEAALKSFREALTANPTPNTRLAVARVLVSLSRFAEAAREFQWAIKDAESRFDSAPEYLRTRDVAQLELRDVLRKVGRLRIRLTPPVPNAEYTINGVVYDAVEVEAGPLPVPAGPLAIRVGAPGYVPTRVDKEVLPGNRITADITLRPHQDTAASNQLVGPDALGSSADDTLAWVGWTTLGVGVLSLAGFGIFYSLAGVTHEELVTDCIDAACSNTTYDALVSRGETYQTVANVTLWTGIALAVTGLGLLTYDQFFRPEVHVGRNSLRLGVSGRF